MKNMFRNNSFWGKILTSTGGSAGGVSSQPSSASWPKATTIIANKSNTAFIFKFLEKFDENCRIYKKQNYERKNYFFYKRKEKRIITFNEFQTKFHRKSLRKRTVIWSECLQKIHF